MEHEQVVAILESLATSADASTRDALAIAAHVVKRNSRPMSAGKPWVAEEDALLSREYEEGTAIHEIAKRHGRSTGGITSRLVKLGKLPPEAVPMRYRPATN